MNENLNQVPEDPSRYLDDLPDDIKEEIRQFLIQGLTVEQIRTAMQAKYGTINDNVNASEISYRRFLSTMRGLLKKDKALSEELAKDSKEVTEAVGDLIEKAFDPTVSLEDRRATLVSLYKQLQTRKSLLEERQKGFIDPQIESIILQNNKEQRMIIESLTEYQEVLDKDITSQMIEEMHNIIDVVVAVTHNAYVKVHPDDQKPAFMQTFADDLEQALKTYDSAKQRQNANKS